MPIYNGMLPVINKDEVKRYAGLRHAEDFPEKFVDEACKEIQLLATPKGVYQEYDYDAENKVILSNPPLKIEGSIIEKHLEKSTKVYVLGVTVGEDVERRSEQLFKQGNYTVGDYKIPLQQQQLNKWLTKLTRLLITLLKNKVMHLHGVLAQAMVTGL